MPPTNAPKTVDDVLPHISLRITVEQAKSVLCGASESGWYCTAPKEFAHVSHTFSPVDTFLREAEREIDRRNMSAKKLNDSARKSASGLWPENIIEVLDPSKRIPCEAVLMGNEQSPFLLKLTDKHVDCGFDQPAFVNGEIRYAFRIWPTRSGHPGIELFYVGMDETGAQWPVYVYPTEGILAARPRLCSSLGSYRDTLREIFGTPVVAHAVSILWGISSDLLGELNRADAEERRTLLR